MKVYLGIDSSTPYLVLGLYSAEKGVLGVYENRLERNVAKHIIPEIDKLIGQAKIKKSNLAGITVGLGPGSYTGIKIAIATAKGLARGLNIHLQGASSLAAIAYSQLQDHETAIIAVDARRDNVYAAVYQKLNDKVILLEKEQKIAIATIKNKYPKTRLIIDSVPSPRYLAALEIDKSNNLKPIYL